MRRGVAVIAAVDGIVAGIRDGMEDTVILEADASSVRGRECGNGVVLRHPNGWTTQYCHMRKGSIGVAKGQEIKRGDRLGDIGLSGLTQFPHVHFEVRNGKNRVEPFVGYEATGKCGSVGKPLFDAAFVEKSPYVETGLLNAGFASRPPKGSEVLNGEHADTTLPVDAPALIYWVELFGTQPGDRDKFTILAPDGSVLVTQTRPALQDHSARHLAFTGRRQPTGGWAPGEYKGVFELLRQEVGETKVAYRLERMVQLGSPQSLAPAATTPPAADVRPSPPPAERESSTVSPTTTQASETATVAESNPQVAAAATPPAPEGSRGFIQRAEDFLPVSVPGTLRRSAGQKGPQPWVIAAALLGVILSMAGVAYITRR